MVFMLQQESEAACWTGWRAPAVMACIKWKVLNGQLELKNVSYKSQSKEPYMHNPEQGSGDFRPKWMPSSSLKKFRPLLLCKRARMLTLLTLAV